MKIQVAGALLLACPAMRVHPCQVQVYGLWNGAVTGVLLLYPAAHEGRRDPWRSRVRCRADAGLAYSHALAVLSHVHCCLDYKLAMEARKVEVCWVQIRSHEFCHKASRGRNVTDVWDGVEQLTGSVLRRRKLVRWGEGTRGRWHGLGRAAPNGFLLLLLLLLLLQDGIGQNKIIVQVQIWLSLLLGHAGACYAGGCRVVWVAAAASLWHTWFLKMGQLLLPFLEIS